MSTFMGKSQNSMIDESFPGDKAALLSPSVLCDVLVLDARARQALVAVRSLGSRGLRVAALETFDDVPAFSSRWCRQKIVCPAEEGTEEYLEFLEQAIDSIGVRVIIPSSDGTIALIRQHRERLEQRVHIALAKEPALGIAINKERTLEVARRLGLGVPSGVLITDVSEVEMALHEIGLPAVVKPTESWVSRGQQRRRIVAQLVTTPDEACRTVEALTSLGGSVLFQPFLSGRRESLALFYAHGEIYAQFAQRVERTDPPLGGTTVLRQSIAVPADTGEQAKRLIREIGLEGFSEIEFRRDSAGNPYLMEINPRLCANIEIGVRAEVDFPYLLYQWANGERIDKVESYHIGGWMRYLWGDIAATVATIQERGRPGVTSPGLAILKFCTTFFVPMRYDYFDWEDLHPAWTATIGRISSLLRYIKRLFLKREK